MPGMKEKQYRSFAKLGAKTEGKRLDSDYYVEGYATTFKPYVLFETENEKIYESFTKESFEGAEMSDIILQFDHEGKVFARQSNGTLIVEVDDHGLFIAADLSKTTSARQLYEEISQGLITKMSWAFKPGEYVFDKKTNTINHKLIKKIYDVSAVSIPANDGTEINARSFVDKEKEKMLKKVHEREKLSLKIKLETM